jgi:hypothetical protein
MDNMTNKPPYNKKKDDDQFLRRMFDFLYSVNLDDVRRAVNRIDRRTRWAIIILIASVILIWAFLKLTQKGIEAIEVANQPSLEERVMPPYDLESRPVPLMDIEALKVVIADATATAALIPTATPTMTPTPTLTPTPMLEGTAEVTAEVIIEIPTATITPTSIPDNLTEEEAKYTILPLTVGNYHLQRKTQPPSLLETCLLSTASEDIESDCNITTTAEYAGLNTYRDNKGHLVEVTIAQFATQEDAAQSLLDLFRYSRSIGRIGNYAMLSSRTVGYYYSSTRERFSFSWSNGAWVYSVSSSRFDSMEDMVKKFPY